MRRFIVGSIDCRWATNHRKLTCAVERANELVRQGDREVTIEDSSTNRRLVVTEPITVAEVQEKLQTEAWRERVN